MEKTENLMFVILICVIALGILDIEFTLIGVSRLGVCMEANPHVIKLFLDNPLKWVLNKYISSVVLLIFGIGIIKNEKVNYFFAYLFSVIGLLLAFSNFSWLYLSIFK